MSKRTVRIEVLEDLHVGLIFKEDSENNDKKVKLILPEIVRDKWYFKSDKEEAAFAGFASAVANEYIKFGLSKEETAQRFKTLIKRTVKAGLMIRKSEHE